MPEAFITPSFRLDGRRALVTGGSKGLGLAAAHALAQAGADVTIVARNTPELIAAYDHITVTSASKAQRIAYFQLDVLQADAVDAFFASQTSFDVVVNNAGTNRPKLLVDASNDDIDAIVDLNVKAAMYVARAAARSMLAAGRGGSIINVSSQMGHVGSPKRSLYCASKHALEGLTKAMAWELGADGIRVNTLCPTFIETPLTAPMLADPAFKAFVLGKIALNRLGRMEEIMGPLVFLASDASSLVTGSALMVDGGWTAA